MAAEIWNQLFDKKSYESLYYHPCFKKSYIVACFPAAVVLAHKIKTYRGYVARAISWSSFVFVVVGAAQFNICSIEEKQKLDLMRQQYKAKHISEAPSEVRKSILPDKQKE